MKKIITATLISVALVASSTVVQAATTKPKPMPFTKTKEKLPAPAKPAAKDKVPAKKK